MSLKRRQFTGEFKFQVLQKADAGKTISQLAREQQDHLTLIHRWRQQIRLQGALIRSCTACSGWPRTA